MDEPRKAVRTWIKFGADIINMTASGGVVSVGTSLDESQYTLEQLEAVVETARNLGFELASVKGDPRILAFASGGEVSRD